MTHDHGASNVHRPELAAIVLFILALAGCMRIYVPNSRVDVDPEAERLRGLGASAERRQPEVLLALPDLDVERPRGEFQDADTLAMTIRVRNGGHVISPSFDVRIDAALRARTPPFAVEYVQGFPRTERFAPIRPGQEGT